MPSLTIEPGSADPNESWDLNDAPRFPTTVEEWDRVVQLPTRPPLKIVGGHAYDLAVNRKARRPVTSTMRRVIRDFRTDFEVAAAFYQPSQWKLLYYLGDYPLPALADPSFDAVRVFHFIYELKTSVVTVPSEWIGSPESSADMLWDLQAFRYEIGSDIAKAAWSILAFAQSLGLERTEVLHVPWWQVWWIERCLAAHR